MSTLGQSVDAAGVGITVGPEDLVTGFVVLAKIVEADGKVRLAFGWSDGMSWVERVGMLRIASLEEERDAPYIAACVRGCPALRLRSIAFLEPT